MQLCYCMCWCEFERVCECELRSFCVFVLYLELVVHSTLSPVRMDGDIPAEMRGGEGSSKGASRWPGRMGTEKKNVYQVSLCL